MFSIISSTAIKDQVFSYLKCAALANSVMLLDAVLQTAVCQTLMNECTLERQSDLGGEGG